MIEVWAYCLILDGVMTQTVQVKMARRSKENKIN
jgi:hypothetical protein